MSLLSRIAESQGAAKAESQEATVDAKVEATKPDAGQVAAEGRNAYSQAVVEGADEDMSEEAPTREEQKKFTEAESLMAEKIYGPQSSAEVIKALQSNGDPVNNVGVLASALISTLETEMGGEFEEELAMGLLETAVEQMVDLLESSDQTVQLNDDQMGEAYSIGVSSWLSANPERAPAGDLDGFSAAAAPAQTGGRPTEQVTNQNQGPQPTNAQTADAIVAEEKNTAPPIARL